MRDFKQLQVWQKAHRFVLDIYRHTRELPAEERLVEAWVRASQP